jgi:hypothetical protein
MNGLPLGPSGSLGQPAAQGGEFLAAQPTAHTGRTLIIVARDQPDLWQALVGHFADSTSVQVLPDRRCWGRRQRVQRDHPDRRRSDRRSPGNDHDLRRRSFVIIRQQDDAGPLEG